MVLVTGCFKDKGNYDYSDINSLEIDMGEGVGYTGSQEIILGESFDILPVIRFVNGSTDASHLTYRWYIKSSGESLPEWTKLHFQWTPHRLMQDAIVLEITDTRTGVQYVQTASIKVKSPYDRFGLQVLSDRDDCAEFSLVRIDEHKSSADQRRFDITKVTPFPDLYREANGTPLGRDAVKLHEHFCDDPSTIGQELILTRNGAVDVNGKDYLRVLDVKDIFLGGQYPTGVEYLSDVMFMARVNVVADQDGYLYTRVKATIQLFHSEYFLPKRVLFENEELKECKLILAPFAYIKGCVIYDTYKKRMLVMADVGAEKGGGVEDEHAGRVLQLPNPVDMPENFLPLNDLSAGNILWVGYFRGDWDTRMGYTIVFEKDGKYFCQEFIMEKDYYSLSYGVAEAKVTEIQGLPGTPTCIYGFPYRDENRLLLLAVGRQLYLYDRDHNSLTLYGKEFDAAITALDGENYYSRWLGIGLENGRVLLTNAAGMERPEDFAIYYDSGADAFGRVKDVRFKIRGGNSWYVK